MLLSRKRKIDHQAIKTVVISRDERLLQWMRKIAAEHDQVFIDFEYISNFDFGLELITTKKMDLVLFVVNVRLNAKISEGKIFLDISENETGSLANLQKELESYNSNISAVENFYSNNLSLGELLRRIADALPPGVYLTGLSYQKTSTQFQLTGFAPTGEALRTFKQNLERQDVFYDISFPPSNWIKPADVEFTASFKVKTATAAK